MSRLRLLAAAALLAAGGAHAATLSLDGVAPGARLAPGTRVVARWEAGASAPEAELLLSLDGGRSFPLRLTPESDPSGRTLSFRVPNLPAAHAAVALRVDEEGSERVRAISEEFAIAPSADAPAERIVPFGGDLSLGEAARGRHGAPLSSGVGAAAPTLSALGDPLDAAETPALAARVAAPAPSGPLGPLAAARAEDPAPFRAAVSRPKRE